MGLGVVYLHSSVTTFKCLKGVLFAIKVFEHYTLRLLLVLPFDPVPYGTDFPGE